MANGQQCDEELDPSRFAAFIYCFFGLQLPSVWEPCWPVTLRDLLEDFDLLVTITRDERTGGQRVDPSAFLLLFKDTGRIKKGP